MATEQAHSLGVEGWGVWSVESQGLALPWGQESPLQASGRPHLPHTLHSLKAPQLGWGFPL